MKYVSNFLRKREVERSETSEFNRRRSDVMSNVHDVDQMGDCSINKSMASDYKIYMLFYDQR